MAALPDAPVPSAEPSADGPDAPDAPAYAELMCQSAFSWGVGTAQPEDLVTRAHALGYQALALTDDCSTAGVVRAHVQAKALGLRFIPGALLPMQHPAGPGQLVALPTDRAAWGALCRFITWLHSRSSPAAHGRPCAPWPHPHWRWLQGCQMLLHAPAWADAPALQWLHQAQDIWGGGLWLALVNHLSPADDAQRQRALQWSAHSGVPCVAVGAVVMDVRSAKPVQDGLTAVRLHRRLRDCGSQLRPNAQGHVRPRPQLAQLFAPEHLAATLEVARRCRFSLDELRYQYPLESLLPGLTPAQTLQQHTWAGAAARYPQGVPDAVARQLRHELALIAELRYEMYFLTVWDLVAFARSRGILCQGRGSAANSAVCYCLGITEVDPARSSLLFERFISRERREPPDIDVDFEHQRREEIIQYIYQRYGRQRAALTAVVIRYRPRSALRDAGRALDVPEPLIRALAREHPGFYGRTLLPERLSAALQRLAPDVPVPHEHTLRLWLEVADGLLGLPRHLSQHPGGFVLTQQPLIDMVPIQAAAMPGRTLIQWDKDDLDALGWLKVDVLALGMLSALRRCLHLVGAWQGRALRLQDIPADDSATFDMLCAADTVGVFQVESRAQMSMLPRLKPRCFYDLVVEVAIVRPGPIQGGMVHPYLQARAQPEAVTYPNPALRTALERTLGVPIFQEQVMQLAMVAAGFSAGEADQLRRAMAAWRRKGGVAAFYDRVVDGMQANGYSAEFAQRIFAQIQGFGEYGFPESHAASFALLVWASSWLKRHHPACFLAALLNSQPMGFYGPSQLVQDAQRHGVRVLPVDVSHSAWDCTLEPAADATQAPDTTAAPPSAPATALADGTPWPPRPEPAVRLGLRLVHGLGAAAAQRIMAARAQQTWQGVDDLAQRAALTRADLDALAQADALASLAGHRRAQLWQARGAALPAPCGALGALPPAREDAPPLAAPPQAQSVRLDYASLGLTLRQHPLYFLRNALSQLQHLPARTLRQQPPGRLVRTSGLVTCRQSPGTAHGVTFITLEDETGHTNVIVWKALKARQREVLLHAQLLAVHGTWQCDPGSGGRVCHVVAGYLQDLTPMLGHLSIPSRDFH